MNVAWTGAINKVKAMNKLTTQARKSSELPELEREVTFGSDIFEADDMKRDRTKSLGDFTNVSDEMSDLQLPPLIREDTIDTLTLHEPDYLSNGFRTNRAKIDNFLMDTVRENGESAFENVT